MLTESLAFLLSFWILSWFLLIFKQVGGLIAMVASFYFLSQGWAMATYSPFYILLFIYLYFFVNLSYALTFSCAFVHIFSPLNIETWDKLNWKIPFNDSLDTEDQTEQVLGMKEMVVPILAGILSALRRVIARRVSLKVLAHLSIHIFSI